MASSNSNLEASKENLEIEGGTEHSVNSTSIHEQLASDATEKEIDGVTQQTEDAPEYIEGLRLTAVMITVFLSTLLSALDVVSLLPLLSPITN